MKVLILVFLTLAGAVLGTQLAKVDPGYVLITRGHWSIELSLTVFVFLLFAIVLLLYWLLRISGGVIRSPKRIGRWRQRKGSHRRLQKASQGLLDLLEGNWVKAEQILKNTAVDGPMPVLGHLAAAYAAQQQGQLENRDRYLEQAAAADDSGSLAVGLTRARLQMNAEQWQEALLVLQNLQRQRSRNPQLLQYLLEVYQALEDWRGMLATLPAAKKIKALPAQELEALQSLACESLLRVAEPDQESLVALWNTFDKYCQQQPALVALYAERLMQAEAGDVASSLLRKTLKKELDDKLLEAYARLPGDTTQQIGFVESLLHNQPRNPVLLQATAQLCLRDKLWGKARGYLESAIAEGADHSAYLELGDLYGQLGEPEKASECFRQGLAQSQHITVQLLAKSPAPVVSSAAGGETLNSKASE